MFHETTSSRGFLENRTGSSAPVVRHIGLTTLQKSTPFSAHHRSEAALSGRQADNLLEFCLKPTKVY
jgi:hypothetical protein